MTPTQASGQIKRWAAEAGFDGCGIATAEPIGRAAYVRQWLDAGCAGSMAYLHDHFTKRTNPTVLLEGARSVIVVALLYNQPYPSARTSPSFGCTDSPPQRRSRDAPERGRIAMYAWGEDYHRVVKDKLFLLVERMQGDLAKPFAYKVCVDTAPLLEREVAAAAGIGWIGKNTMVLSEHLGSYFFLGEIVTTLELQPDRSSPGHCGSCTACLDACPTNALSAPYEMDASRCISYLTIEHRDDIPSDLEKLTGNWLFGCDICQEVCPYNRRAPMTIEPRFRVRPPAPDVPLEQFLGWSKDDHRRQLSHSAIKRAKPEMLRRNARIAWENGKALSDRRCPP